MKIQLKNVCVDAFDIYKTEP